MHVSEGHRLGNLTNELTPFEKLPVSLGKIHLLDLKMAIWDHFGSRDRMMHPRSVADALSSALLPLRLLA